MENLEAELKKANTLRWIPFAGYFFENKAVDLSLEKYVCPGNHAVPLKVDILHWANGAYQGAWVGAAACAALLYPLINSYIQK